MTKRFSFEIGAIGIIIAILAIVISTGISAYKSLTGIVNDVHVAATPDTKILLMKQITSELSDAESKVKSYYLTRDESYLTPYYKSIYTMRGRTNELRALENNLSQRALIDRIVNLIDKKYRLLNDLLSLQNNERVTEELKRISGKIDQSVQDTLTLIVTDPVEEPQKKKGLFKKIFGSKKNTEVPAATIAPSVSENTKLKQIQKDIRNEVTVVKKEQTNRLQKIKMQELELTEKDKEVMDNIRSLMLQLENAEVQSIVQKTKMATDRAEQATVIIGIFCFAAITLLLAAIYVIIKYIQSSRAYSEALKLAKAEAESLADAKQNFLANMSHEIRTPLNSIVGFTEQIIQTELGKQQKEQLNAVKKSADHLLKIINDVLDYSKMQVGKFQFDRVGFYPEAVIKDVIQLITPQAKKKNLDLFYTFENNIPEILIGDPVRLQQILINVFSNAVKFTEKGNVSIRVFAVLQSKKNIVLSMSIEDTGIGIEKEKIIRIFKEFEQADTSISRKYGGTGLGLSITKKLIELQNGNLEIASDISKGTKVMLDIPYLIGTSKDVESDKSTPIEHLSEILKGKNVLVADDEEFNRMLVVAILKKWNVNVVEARNGKEVLSALQRNNYDIILMDIRMPDMSGIDVCRHIRNLHDERKANTPIIALSAATSVEKIRRSIDAGMNDFISKPFKEQELCEKIVKSLKLEVST